MLKKVLRYLTYDIWRFRLKDLPRVRSAIMRNFRIIILAIRGYKEDNCILRASALTLYTLLSIVPIAALVFGISQGVGMQQRIETQLLENLPAQEEVLIKIVTFANAAIENTKGGLMAVVSTAVLFWFIIKMLWFLEHSFDKIWGIRKTRSFLRKLSVYSSLIILCPIFLLVSSSITMFITAQLELITQKIAFMNMLSPVIFPSLKLLPYLLIWILLSFLYIFMPNTKVRISSGILGGMVAGTIYVIVQWAYLSFQIGVAKHNAIYGSFAALPLFLIWLQISWLIVLFGAEISFAHQNVETYEFEPDCRHLSHHSRRLVSIYMLHHIMTVTRDTGKPGKTSASEISHDLEIPIRLTREILYGLEKSDLVSMKYDHKAKEPLYFPHEQLGSLTLKECIEALDKKGSDHIPIKDTIGLEKLAKVLEGPSQNIPFNEIV